MADGEVGFLGGDVCDGEFPEPMGIPEVSLSLFRFGD